MGIPQPDYINEPSNFSSTSEYTMPPPVIYMQQPATNNKNCLFVVHASILMVLAAIPLFVSGIIALGVIVALFASYYFDPISLIYLIPFVLYLGKYISIVSSMIGVLNRTPVVVLIANTLLCVFIILDILGWIAYTVIYCIIATDIYDLAVYLGWTVTIDVIWALVIIFSITYFIHSTVKAIKVANTNSSNQTPQFTAIPLQQI